MTHSAHDTGCAARNSEKCNCEQGRLRKIKQRAVKSMKRRDKKQKPNWWLERIFHASP
jgi:hypothetical protein